MKQHHTGPVAAVSLGAASCWGSGDSGRLGRGGTGNSQVPVAVSTSGVLRKPVCDSDWVHAPADRCAPGPNLAVSYTVGYAKAGWSPPSSNTVTATWTGAP